MAIDFFNNDVIRGDNYSGREYSESLKPEDTEKAPDFFKDEKLTQKEVLDETVKEEVIAKEETEEVVEIEEPTKEVDQPTVKELAAAFGNKEYKLPVDSKFKHKVDEQEVEVSLQELLNNYSGKTSWDKKFTELDKERQATKKELDQVNKYINEFATKAKTDRIGAFEFLAEAAGLDPLEFRKAIRKDLLQANKNYLEMDDQTRNAYELKEENEYFRNKKSLEEKRRGEEQAHREFETRINNTKQTHGISDERLNELVSDLKQYGGVDQPSLDDVVNLHSAYIRQDRAVAVLNKINPELLKDESKLSTLESLISGNSKLSDNDLQDYASKLWGKSVKKVEPKKQPNVSKTNASANTTFQKKVIGGGNFDFFK